MAKQPVITKGIERMRQARARLMLNQLFFGTAATALKLIEDQGVRTAGTDGRVIRFRPDYVNKLDIGEVEFLVCHEVMHCVLMHPLRLQGRDHKLANKAMDYVINGILIRSGMKMIQGGLYDETLSSREMSWENVYAILWKQEQKQKQKQKEQEKKQDGEGGQGQPGDKTQDEPQDEPQDDGNGQNDGQGKDAPEDAPEGKGKGKSGVPENAPEDVKGQGQGDGQGEGNEPEPWEIGEVTEPKGDDGQALSESEISNIEQDWKVTAQRALQASQGCGSTPDGMERIVNEMTVEKRDLEDVLRDFIQKTFDGDYSYRRPNRKQIIHDIYAPSIEGEKIPTIVMVQDTSGSIGDRETNYFTAKLNSVLSEYNTHLHVIYCDTRCHDGGEYDRDDLPVVLKPMGGGGTDFRPAFEWIEKNDIEPTCLIYFTDGECDRFPEEPDYPVLWALYGREREFPFGETVNIDPDK